MRSIFTLLFSLFICTNAYCQQFFDDNYGITFGASIALGTPVSRIGIGFNAYANYENAQANFSTRLFWNYRALGPRNTSRELQASLGLVGAFGPQHFIENNAYLSPVGNQTGYAYSAGYAYSIYVDNNQTSQPAGMIGFKIKDLFLVHENDILAGTGDDKFRTGGLLIAYHYEGRRYALNYIGWTGDPRSDGVVKVKNSDYPAKKGYRDLSEGTHGKFSHGILALQVEEVFDYGQVGRIQLGIDAEQIRNLLQNQFMHERITNGSHYPMLDENGEPYLNPSEQKVRRIKPYLQLGINPTLFY